MIRADVAVPEIVARKLAALDALEPEFAAAFRYVQEVQGLARLDPLPIAGTVRYLQALAICDAKDRLLSVPRVVDRYDGATCLDLLVAWQEGPSTAVVALLHRRLDALPFADLTRQIEQARQGNAGGATLERLEHGRRVLLNRGYNLLHALEPIFALAPEELARQVRAACAESGDTPERLAQRRAALDGPLYASLRHPALAQRNMRLMDGVGVAAPPDAHQPPLAAPDLVAPPYAECVITGYVALTSPRHNNPAGLRLTDAPARGAG
ncbi:MAG TPA: hypothetical protein VGR57_01190 [Ktedonobacterales bacterium]|nr:hypothetical protein [Ktedonobacterales bacterium]